MMHHFCHASPRKLLISLVMPLLAGAGAAPATQHQHLHHCPQQESSGNAPLGLQSLET
jgi:hypothetical protein